VLGLEYQKRKKEWYALITVTLLISSVVLTYYVCQWSEESFYDSWASSAGEGCIAGALLVM